MREKSITVSQTFMILVTSVGLLSHVIVLPVLLQVSKRDSWLTILITLMISIWFIPLIYFIMTKTRQEHIIVWMKEKYGKLTAWFFGVSFSLCLLLMSWFTLYDTITWTFVTYMPQTPKWILLFFFLMICLYNAHAGIRSIANTTGLLLPIVLLFGFFVSFVNFPYKDFSVLKPIMENGYQPIFKGMMFVGVGLIQLITVIFMQHHIQSPVRARAITFNYFFFGVLFMGPTIGALTEFGPIEAAHLRYPGYEQWRLVQLGRYIEHLDFLSIYQWLTGAFIQVSLTLFLIPDLFNLPKGSKRNGLLMILFFVLLGASMLKTSDITFLNLLEHILPFLLLFLFSLTILLVALVLIKGREEGGR